MAWQNKRVQCAASVLFRGTIPPRAQDFAYLLKMGIKVKRKDLGPDVHWTLQLAHPQWGEAELLCIRGLPQLPRALVEYDPRLTKEEQETAIQGKSTVTLRMEGTRGNVLRDRKSMLRFMRAVMGDDGVISLDHVSQRLWSREALDDELSHDADLDVDALYVMHLVGEDGSETPTWLHTHGLAEMGFFDFDILRPSEILWTRGIDALRSIAFAIVEGRLPSSINKYNIASPGGVVRMLDVREFLRRADRETAALRIGADDEHNHDRSVICEPPAAVFGRWFGRVKPSTFLSNPPEEEMLMAFSNEATELMAQRARLTYAQFRSLHQEFAEFEFTSIVKLGYQIDGGGPTDREHLWFEVHAMTDDKIDATLGSEPFNIERMKAGQRGWHSTDLLSDWMIITPIGMVNPRDTSPARSIRANRDEFRKLLKEAKEAET